MYVYIYIYTSTAILQYHVYYIVYTLYIHSNPWRMNKSVGQPSATLGLLLQEVVTTWAQSHGRCGAGDLVRGDSFQVDSTSDHWWLIKKYFLRVIPTVNHFYDISSDILTYHLEVIIYIAYLF